MPRVPVPQNFSQTPQVQSPRQLATPDTSAPDQTAGLRQAAGQAADAVFQFALTQQQQANASRVDDAMAQLIETEQQLTLDEKDGYVQLRGREALERPSGVSLIDEYTGKRTTTIDRLRGGLANDTQREAFDRQVQARDSAWRSGLMRHAAQQSADYRESTFNGRINRHQREISGLYGNPEQVALATQSVQATIYARYKDELSPEEIDQKIVEALSPAHVSAISQAVAVGDSEYADAYLTQYANQLVPSSLARMESLVKDGHAVTDAQVFVDDQVAANGDDWRSIRANIRRELTGAAREKALALVNRRRIEDEQELAEAEETALASFTAALADAGGDYDAVNPAYWAALSDGQRAQMNMNLNAWRQQQKKLAAAKTKAERDALAKETREARKRNLIRMRVAFGELTPEQRASTTFQIFPAGFGLAGDPEAEQWMQKAINESQAVKFGNGLSWADVEKVTYRAATLNGTLPRGLEADEMDAAQYDSYTKFRDRVIGGLETAASNGETIDRALLDSTVKRSRGEMVTTDTFLSTKEVNIDTLNIDPTSDDSIQKSGVSAVVVLQTTPVPGTNSAFPRRREKRIYAHEIPTDARTHIIREYQRRHDDFLAQGKPGLPPITLKEIVRRYADGMAREAAMYPDDPVYDEFRGVTAIEVK